MPAGLREIMRSCRKKTAFHCDEEGGGNCNFQTMVRLIEEEKPLEGWVSHS